MTDAEFDALQVGDVVYELYRDMPRIARLIAWEVWARDHNGLDLRDGPAISRQDVTSTSSPWFSAWMPAAHALLRRLTWEKCLFEDKARSAENAARTLQKELDAACADST